MVNMFIQHDITYRVLFKEILTFLFRAYIHYYRHLKIFKLHIFKINFLL